jgi:hypothetical protein
MNGLNGETETSIDEKRIIAEGKKYQESITYTDNTRLASVFLVFGAVFHKACPLEWVDIHKSRETFIRNLEDPTNPEYQPKPKVTFNFVSGSVPEVEIIKAFETDYEKLNSQLDELMINLQEQQKMAIRMAVSRLITRACHEVLLRREELVRQIKRVPHNAKFDQISNRGRTVRMGKNSSPELRSRYLSKVSD